MNFEKIKAVWACTKAGKAIADPVALKSGQVKVNQFITFVGALALTAKAFGYDLHMDDQTIAYIGGGLYGAVNWVFTVLSTDKIGFSGIRPKAAGVAGPAGDAAAGGDASAASPVGGVSADSRAAGEVWVKAQYPDAPRGIGPSGDGP